METTQGKQLCTMAFSENMCFFYIKQMKGTIKFNCTEKMLTDIKKLPSSTNDVLTNPFFICIFPLCDKSIRFLKGNH